GASADRPGASRLALRRNDRDRCLRPRAAGHWAKRPAPAPDLTPDKTRSRVRWVNAKAAPHHRANRWLNVGHRERKPSPEARSSRHATRTGAFPYSSLTRRSPRPPVRPPAWFHPAKNPGLDWTRWKALIAADRLKDQTEPHP